MFLRLDAGPVGVFIATQRHFKQFREGPRRVFPAAGSVSPHRNLGLHPVPVWVIERTRLRGSVVHVAGGGVDRLNALG